MTKRESGTNIEAVLIRPFEAFFGNCLPVGVACIITAEHTDTYNVKFPDVIGYSGTHSIKKCCVSIK
jgi:hypothetical protein